jgi:hypothetical protein
MAKRKKKYQYDEGYPQILETQSFEFTWCCDCGLRHVNFYEIERGKKPEDDKVKVYCIRDSHATDYRKDYNRLKSRLKKRKGKK